MWYDCNKILFICYESRDVALSSITLAAMEDSGFYIANYSSADEYLYGKGNDYRPMFHFFSSLEIYFWISDISILCI